MSSPRAWRLYDASRGALVGMSVLSALLAVTTLATGANTLRVFNSTLNTNQFWLPLFNTYTINGAYSLVGSSAIAFILQAIFLFTTCMPKFNLKAHPTIITLNTIVLSVLSGIALLVGLVFAHVLNKHYPDILTIQTWTCAKQHVPRLNGAAKTSVVDNSGFTSLCLQSRYAIWGALVIFILQIFMFTLAIVSYVMEKLAARRMRKSGSSSPDGSLELVGTGYTNDKHPTVVAARPY